MTKLIWGALTFISALHAQTPTVTGVVNERRNAAVIAPGVIGYILGTNFGDIGNTTVAAGGRSARVLAVAGDRIHVEFPPDLPPGLLPVIVTVNGQPSAAVNMLVSDAPPPTGDRGRRVYSPSHRRLAPPSAEAVASATPAAGSTGIVYTCDPTVTAAYASACSVLNTTIAALYKNAFANANANIYITLGATALGQSNYAINVQSYSRVRNALIAAEASANDITAVTGSVPATDPLGGSTVELPNPLARALGFPAGSGIPFSGNGFCTIGTANCYDGVITISNSTGLYFRNGSIGSDQYDFFTVVEHETDEILGTASCLLLCGGDIAPPDFFRYHSDGSRSTAPGENTSCSSPDSGNACFSLDGANMLLQYNNVDNGEDFGDWGYNACGGRSLVQNAALCGGVANIDISPTAEILVLDVIGYTLASTPPASVTNVTSSSPSGTYGNTAILTVQITFSSAVTVTGIPQLALNSGGIATYTSGSGSSALNFVYMVGTGQSSSHLDYTSTNALTLNAGTIDGPGSTAASLTLPAPGSAGSLGGNTNIIITATSNTAITIQTSPAGLQFTIDGGSLETAPQTLSLTQGAHTIAVASPQNPSTGVRNIFSSWSDGGGQSHSITVGPVAATYTASFSTQYLLTIGASPPSGGSVSPASGNYYPGNTVVNVTAASNSGYTFAGWSGPVASASSAATTVTMTGAITVTAAFSATTQTSGLAFFPITPCRVADTRSGSGQFGAPSMAGGSTRSFDLAQSPCNIPATARAYSLNVTAVPPGPLIYLSIWPTGQSQPTVSTLNSFDGQVVANAAIVPAGTNSSLSVYVSNTTDVILDVDGYFAPPATGGLAFYPVTPCRVADTRSGSGNFGGPQMAAGQTRSFPVASSNCGVPGTAQAYSLNMTAVPPAPLIYLSVWPAGLSQPIVSTLNSFNGRVVANAAIVPSGSGAGGPIDVFVSNASDVIIDINGYFAPPGGAGALYFYTTTPCRIVDTRSGSGFPAGFGSPSLAGNASRSFAVQSSGCGLPAAAQAYSFNMTVVPTGLLAYLTSWPTGVTQPTVSTLNSFNGTVVANAAIVPAGTGGAISIFVSNLTDFILDINGYFAP